jgi:hypothetical protein
MLVERYVFAAEGWVLLRLIRLYQGRLKCGLLMEQLRRFLDAT